MHKVFQHALIAFAILLLGSFPGWSQTAVTAVDYGNDGQIQGSFMRLQNGLWQETDNQGQTFSFSEVSRDNDTIRLEDASRNLALTLDVTKNSITFGAIGDLAQQHLYQIIATRRATAGQADAMRVVYGENGASLGSFVNEAQGTWAEIDTTGKSIYTFSEISRTPERVELQDSSRNLALTLSLSEKRVTFGVIGEAQQPLYQILEITGSAEPTASGPTVVEFGGNGEKQGSYVNTGPGTWDELDKSGNKLFSFIEKSSSPDKITFEDQSRGLALTLDLTNKLVSFGAIGDERQEPLYEIMAATTSATTTPEVEIASPAAEDPIPSQIKLKNLGSYSSRFTVTWTPPGTDETSSWTSDPQPKGFFQVLPVPEGSSSLKIVGEANLNGEWNALIDRTIDHASNKCYMLVGTEILPDYRISDESSDSLGDDCS